MQEGSTAGRSRERYDGGLAVLPLHKRLNFFRYRSLVKDADTISMEVSSLLTTISTDIKYVL
jgi:hypothetical protein